MFNLFKLGFKLGYKFAERHYYQQLVMSIRSRAETELSMWEATDDEKKERAYKTAKFERQALQIIDGAFMKHKVERDTYRPVTPFEDGLDGIL